MGVVKASSGSPLRRVRVLEAGQRRINLASGPIVAGRAIAGARGSGHIGASTGGSRLDSLSKVRSVRRSSLGSLRALQVGLKSRSFGSVAVGRRCRVALTTGGVAEVGRFAGIRHCQLPGLSGSPSSGGLEAGLFITRIGLSLGQGYVHDLRYRGRSSSRGRLWRWVRSMSRRQAVKVVGRERRNLAVVSSSGGSKLWRYNANSLWRQQ